MAQPAVTTPTPPVKADHDRAPPPQLQTTAVEQEAHQPTTSNSQSSQQLPSQLPQEPQSPPPVPHFITSIKELRDLSDALSAFHRCYDDLQTHLDSIKSAIESKLPQQLPNASLPASTQTPTNETSINIVQTSLNPAEENEEVQERSIIPTQTEVESLCVTMSSRGLRKYMVANLGESNKLREEVPKALKLAPNPATLVLECSGRFFLQGSKAYTRDSHMIPAREASILVLECFLLMGGEDGVGAQVRIEKAVKQESEQAAVAWRKRLISEGGLAKASEIDVRGLLLFLGCFGVPQVFRYDDFRDLARAGNVKEISGVLKRSRLLSAKIQDVIEGMVKNKMAVDAVDLAYTFGLEDKFTTQTMLTSFLRDSKEFWKKTKKASQGSLVNLNEANKKQLAALRSVVECLERHNVDPSKLLPGWQISSKILRLEKDISDLDKNIRERTAKKRKADGPDSSKKLRTPELKHSCYTSNGLQQAAAHADSHRNLLNGIPGHTSSFFASRSLLHGTGTGLLPENISGSVTGIVDGILGDGVGSSMSAAAAGLLPTDSYAGVHGGPFIDAAGLIAKYTSQPYGLHGDAAYGEQLGAHGYTGQASSLGHTSLYRVSSALKGFAGLPSSTSAGASNRSSASDLYQFADAVVESESYYSRASNPVGAVPSVAPVHHSSRLY